MTRPLSLSLSLSLCHSHRVTESVSTSLMVTVAGGPVKTLPPHPLPINEHSPEVKQGAEWGKMYAGKGQEMLVPCLSIPLVLLSHGTPLFHTHTHTHPYVGELE